MQVWADEMHVNPNFFVYNWSGAWIPTANMLEIKGFNCAANSSGIYSNNMTNKYFLGRINIADSSSWASMSSIVF